MTGTLLEMQRRSQSLAIALLWIVCWGAAVHADSEEIGRRPYRILVSVSFEQQPLMTTSFRQSMLQATADEATRVEGAMWRLELREEDDWLPLGRAGLERPDAQQMQHWAEQGGYDQIALLTIGCEGSCVNVAGRAWEASSRSLGPIRSVETCDRRAVGSAAVRLVEMLFRPVLVLDSVDEDRAFLRLRAGELLSPDPNAAQVVAGDILQPHVRYLDREEAVSDVRGLPWTYLVVETVERRWVTARIVSALRTPLGTTGRRRVETIAVRVRPASETTRIQLVAQGESGQPLAGCDVTAVAKLFAEDEPASAPQRLMTDRGGRLTLARHDKSPLVWLSIKSGDALLARVPFCPGIEPEAVLELPDDSLRLKVEGDLSLLDARLIDTVARRATLLARMRLLARESDWDAVAARREELEKLPDTAAFEGLLAAIRIPALEQARTAGNRVAEARIRKLCTQTSDLIRRYLDKDKIRVVLEEIEELRRLDREEDRAGDL